MAHPPHQAHPRGAPSPEPHELPQPGAGGSHALAGTVCQLLKRMGMDLLNPGNAKLNALLNAGVSVGQIEDAARKALDKGKTFTYALAIVEREERDARDLGKQLELQRVDQQAGTETFAQRAARLRMEEIAPIAVAILDEWTDFDQTVGASKDKTSGSPGSLAKGRLEGAPYPKFVGGSTPGIKGFCHVSRACEDSDDEVTYLIQCPHCDIEHALTWGGPEVLHGFKWQAGQPDTVCHICPHCRESITQADYMPGGWPLTGAWVCRKSGKRFGADQTWRDARGQPCAPPRTLGVHVWAAYSPQRPWSSIVDEYEKASRALVEGDAGPMTTFTNETLGEAWELKGEGADQHVLQARAEPYVLKTVPVGGLMLFAGVDVQHTWWDINIWAFGRGLESWVVDHHIIEGNHANDADWEPVHDYLQRRYPHPPVCKSRISLANAIRMCCEQLRICWPKCPKGMRPILG